MFFNILFFIYTFIYFPYLILTGRWYTGYEARLGFFSPALKARIPACCSVWIHAVSVGEVVAVSGLIDKIKTRWPSRNIILTTTTKTGYELACAKLGSTVVVIPSPLDFTFVVESFVRLIKPKIYIVAETEIWPNLFSCLHKNQIPLVIINGRISDASLGRYKAIQFILKDVLDKVSLFCMQSQLNADRIIALGASPQKVISLGNIKFDNVSSHQNETDVFMSMDRSLWIAGSTHPGEEEIILKVYSKHKASWRLVIAPRHVERSQEIITLIQAHGFKAIRFSEMPKDRLTDDSVIVVDTIGQLSFLYKQASLVFVGKSLCGGGGQNIIEPAMYAKPIIVGPLMENFRDIAALFNAQEAIVQVKDVAEFQAEVNRLMNDASLREQLGQRAYKVVQDNQGASQRILEKLEEWL